MGKCGTTEEHCCWFKGVVCEYLEPSKNDDFIWQCRLRASKDSWEEVHKSKEYIDNIKPKWYSIGHPTTNCGDWPPVGNHCNDCGEGK
jgi:hypothetical protein